MKKFFVIALMLAVSLSTFGDKRRRQVVASRDRLPPPKPVHFMTVDDSGRPIPGMKVIVNWYFDGGSEGYEKLYVSDKDGIFCSEGSFPGEHAHLEFLPKEGYVYEGYLNHGEGWISWVLDSYPRERPYKLVFRKEIPEKGLCISHKCKNNDIRIFRRGEKKDPLPLAVVLKPGLNGETQPADCFARTEFDEVKKAWKCTFWTTNVNGGVFATTNRVFIAPATGYQKRIEVPMEMCCSPTFTLYVKTYDPLLYAMFRLHCFGADRVNTHSPEWIGWRDVLDNPKKYYPDSKKPYAGIALANCCYNVSGERFLESDSSAEEALGPFYFVNEVSPVLAQHRYPPRPDIPARAKNMQRRKALREELSQISERRTQMSGDGDNKQHQKELDALRLREYECRREIRQLEAEARKLNLPD